MSQDISKILLNISCSIYNISVSNTSTPVCTDFNTSTTVNPVPPTSPTGISYKEVLVFIILPMLIFALVSLALYQTHFLRNFVQRTPAPAAPPPDAPAGQQHFQIRYVHQNSRVFVVREHW